MSESFDRLVRALRKLPGLGAKSAERMALHLALERQDEAREIAAAISTALGRVTPCPECAGLSEDGELCAICGNPGRRQDAICIVERSSDIAAIEKSGAWRGVYHVLGGKLSPIKNIGVGDLNFKQLESRVASGEVCEIVLALSNDIEGEATCHYVMKKFENVGNLRLTRIGFGLPSGSQLGFADSGTIKSALDSRKNF